MIALGNPFAVPNSHELTARGLLDVLVSRPDMPLGFFYDGRAIKNGYHITEVKTGRFTALDCGANPEAWTETFIQLWDVDEPPHAYMSAGKFVAIIDKVAALATFEPDTRLTFEVSDGEGAIQLFHAKQIDISDNGFVVSLAKRPASCKPRDRWLSEQRASSDCRASACCAS